MSYTFSIQEGANTVPTGRSLTGVSAIKLVLDRGGSSAPVEITSGLSVSGTNVIVTVPAGQLAGFQGTEYRIVGTIAGASITLQEGRINSAKTAAGASKEVTIVGQVNILESPNGQLIRTVQDRIRDDFAGTAINTDFWDVVTGPGMTVSVASSALSIASGTTANSVTTLRSKRSWSGAYRVMFISAANLLSQRIANHTVELRVVNAAGTSYAGWVLTGTTATTGIARAYNNGTTSGDQSVTGIPTTASPVALELENFIDEVYFHSRTPESTNARSTSNVKNRQTPDPTEPMFIEIRVTNGATAPASSTTLNLDSVLVQDISELTAEITGGRGSGGASQAIPVVMATQPNVNITNSSLATSNFVGSASLSTTNLTAGASYTQPAVDQGTNINIYATRSRPVVMHLAGLVPGTLKLEESTDGTTYRETWRSPVPSDGLYHTFEAPVHYRYYRWVFTNGSTAQTGFFIGNSTFRGEGPTDIDKALNFPLTATAGQALALSATFTGPVLDLGGNHMWDKVRVFASSDQASAAGGVKIQQSMDGTNWYDANAGTNTAGAGIVVESLISCRYIRVIYVNGATAATVLRVAESLVSL